MRGRPLFVYLFSVIAASNVYEKDGEVEVFVNKVGPYFNPHETYHYYSLPVCRPKEIKHRPLTLGEVLDGDRMAYSLYNIRFMKNEKLKRLCSVSLRPEDIEKLKEAIRELYYFEFSIDDLRKFQIFSIATYIKIKAVRGFIGHFEEGGLIPVPRVERCYLWSSLHFAFTYNNGHIISANVSTAGSHPIALDDLSGGELKIEFSYSGEIIITVWKIVKHIFFSRVD